VSKYAGYVREIDGELTFKQIGQRLGLSTTNVAYHYERAIAKLKQNPAQFREFIELVNYRQKLRDSRAYGVLGVED
jgi:hypothetical protein